MSTDDVLDSHIIKTGLQYEQITDHTWVLHPESARGADIAVRVDDPIVVFSIQLFELGPRTPDREGLFHKLLELNAELLHSAYAIQGDRIVLSGAHQLENLDFNEFQAMIDDMCMALDNHYAVIAPWHTGESTKAANDEGSH